MSWVVRHATKHGWHLDFQMCYTGDVPHGWEGDGVITTLSGNPAEMAAFLERVGCPAVSLNPNYPEIPVLRVSIDMASVGRLAAQHFLERGFKSFALYTPHSWHTTKLAHAAFIDEVQSAEGSVYELSWQDKRGTTGDRAISF